MRKDGKSIITFDEICGFAKGNNRVFNEILNHVKKTNDIVPFVGAGLSAPVYPLWGKALEAIADKFSDENNKKQCKQLLKEKKYLEAAQFLENQRSAIVLCDDFRDVFAPSKLENNIGDIRKMAVWLLPLLFKGLAVTTNLDRMLEYVYEQHGLPFSEAYLPGERPATLTKNLRSPGAHYLYKFHGTIDGGGSLDYTRTVFTQKQYDEHYKPDSDVVRALEDVYRMKPLLFLGCSLEQDKTIEVLGNVVRPGMENYAIVSCKPNERDAKINALGALGIRAILYPDGRHEAVRVILEKLLEQTDQGIFRTLTHVSGAAESPEVQYNTRFQYTSGLYETVGREREMQALEDFLKDEATFRWWAVVGPGGTGKSRLALTLSERLPADWAYKNLTRENYRNGLSQLSHPLQNTVYVADYVQAYVPEIGDWIREMAETFSMSKIRLLLLERDGGDWERRLRERWQGDPLTEAAQYRREDGFLTPEVLKDEELLALMDRFAEAVCSLPLAKDYRPWLGGDVGKKLLAALERVDPALNRPLYALFLTDSWLSGEEPEEWNRETLLGQVLDREERLLRARAEKMTDPKKPDRLMVSVLSALRTATVLQDASTEELKELAPTEWAKLEKAAEDMGLVSAADLMAGLGLGDGHGVSALRPDILGEYFVLRWVQGNPTAARDFLAGLWQRPVETAVFLDLLFADFADVLDGALWQWETLLTAPDDLLRWGAVVYAMLLANAAAWTKRQETSRAAVTRLETLRKEWPEDQEMAVRLAKGLVNLSAKQDADGAAETVNRLDALQKECPQDREMAVKLAEGLVNLTVVQDADGAAETVKRLEALAEEWPEDREMAVRLAIGLLNLSPKQDEADAAKTAGRLEALRKECPEDQKVAVMLANRLVNLTFEQDEAGRAATVDWLEALRKEWSEDREIAVSLAEGLVNLTVVQDADGAAETVKRVETLAEEWPEDREIAMSFAKGLVNLSGKQNEMGAAETVNRLEMLRKEWPEDREIAVRLAESLYNLAREQDRADVAATVNRLEALRKEWPEDHEMAVEFASGLFNLSTKQDADGMAETAGRLETLRKEWPEDREMAVKLAKGFVNLSAKQNADGAAKTVDRLEALRKEWPEDREMAVSLAWGLVKLSNEQNADGAAKAVDRLEALRKEWSEDREMAVRLSWGLVILAEKQDGTGRAETVKRLEALKKEWPGDREMAVSLAWGLVKLSVKQNADGAAETVGRLEALKKEWPGDREMAVKLADGLVNLSAEQDADGAAETVKRLDALKKEWPEDQEMAVNLASGLLNLANMQNRDGVAKTVDRLRALQKEWPKDWDMAMVLAKGMLNLLSKQDAEDARRRSRSWRHWPGNDPESV